MEAVNGCVFAFVGDLGLDGVKDVGLGLAKAKAKVWFALGCRIMDGPSDIIR